MDKNLLFKKLISCKRAILLCLLAMFTCFAAFAQNRQITGKVISTEDGMGIPGVSIKIKGTNLGVVTDAKGVFNLSASNGAVLEFSFIGYNTQQVTVVEGKNFYSVSLSPSSKALAEVNVVSIGYGTSKARDINGSVSSVSAAQIEKTPVTTLDQALQGRAAGVQVTNNDGAPGGNVTVMIRGVGSLASGGNGPLYIVDGYPIVGGINNINPNDIATLDILKDASATAIYGVRGANGVIVVTTKKGRKDGLQVSVDAYNAFQSKPKEYNVLNAQQWATLANQVAAADPQHNFVELPQWTTPSSLTNADWQNAVYRTGLTQNYSVAIRGGNDKVQSAVSVGYYDQKGIVLGSYFKRATLGLNLDYIPTKWLKSSTSAKYAYQDQNVPFGTGNLVQLAELIPTLDGGNSQTSQIKDANGNYGFFNPINTYTAKYSNPVYTIETLQAQNITNYLLTSSSLEATLYDGLKIKTNLGINISNYSGSYFTPEDDRQQNQYGTGAAPTNAFYSQHVNNSFEYLWENTLSYDKTFGKHAISFVAGISQQKNTASFMGGSGIPPNNVIRDLNQSTNLKLDQYGNGQNVTSYASQFSRLTYKYADRYSLSGVIRRDGSNKFAEEHQYGIFPSGAVSWRAKNESFLKNVDWLSDLKLRGSYGKVGNERGISLYQFAALYSTGSAAATSGNLGYPFNKIYQGGIAQIQPANPNLRWETDYETDIGADMAFLNGDLTLTVDWYKRDSKDFLLYLASPIQSGYAYQSRNVGSIQNKGLEFAVNYNHRINDFKFGLGLTLSTVSNTLTSLTSGTDLVTNVGGLSLAGIGWSTFTETHVGQPIGEFYGYKSLGIFQTQAQINALNATAAAKNPGNPYYQKSGTGPGDRYFADINGDGQVTADDQTSLGSPIPKFFGGFNIDASYKAWDFNVYFYGVYGNKLLNYQESTLESFQNRSFVGVENVSYDYYVNHWTPTNPSNRYSKATYNDDAIGSNVPSSQWIENGSFLKLKNVTVGYTLPSNLVKKISLTKVRVYFSTQNLFTITKYTGLDPEIGIQGGNATQNGVDSGTYPSSKFYTVGFNVTF